MGSSFCGGDSVKRRMSVCKRWGILLIGAAFLLAVVFVRLDSKLRPLIQDYGIQSVRRSAMMAVHKGVENVLATQETAYHDLIAVSRDDNGRVLSAEANIAAINLLKSRSATAVVEQLNACENQQISIPMGSVIGGSFFIGRGPFLKFNIHTNGSILTTLSSAFTDAGINQTCHQIYLNMKIYMTALLPMERKSIELSTQFLVCETILVGEVPQAYTHLDFDNQDTLAKFFGEND